MSDTDQLHIQINYDDFKHLSLNQVDAIEQITNGSIEELTNFAKEGKPKGKVLRALAVIALNKSNPVKYPIFNSAQVDVLDKLVGELDFASLVAAPTTEVEAVKPNPKGSKATKTA